MKTILNQLKKQRTKLVKTSEKRDEYYNNRSEAWQNGVGAIYEIKTQQLADIISGLDKSIKELEDYLNDC